MVPILFMNSFCFFFFFWNSFYLISSVLGVIYATRRVSRDTQVEEQLDLQHYIICAYVSSSKVNNTEP